MRLMLSSLAETDNWLRMSFQKSNPAIGARPGTLAVPPGSPPPQVRIMHYTEAGVQELDIAHISELQSRETHTGVTWIDVQGLGDEAICTRLETFLSCTLSFWKMRSIFHSGPRLNSLMTTNSSLRVCRSPRLTGQAHHRRCVSSWGGIILSLSRSDILNFLTPSANASGLAWDRSGRWGQTIWPTHYLIP